MVLAAGNDTCQARWGCLRGPVQDACQGGALQHAESHQPIAAQGVTSARARATGLPKTRSGKIMRRILRKIAVKADNELGDVSTLADPSVVKAIIDLRGK
jgi:hypothetical protein